MPIRVVSKRSGGTKAKPGETVINIARPSILGNPFYMKDESQRTRVVAQYKEWLRVNYDKGHPLKDELHRIAARVKKGEHIALECWCAPCACHGDVVIEAIEWINKQEK